MVGFILGVLFTLLTLGVGFASYQLGRKGTKIEDILSKEQKIKQELQLRQLDDFSNMMNYDVDVAYDRKEV